MRVSYSSGMRKFTAIIQKDGNMYVAKCAEIGTVSQGKTIEKAIANLKEATELYLEEFPMKEFKNTKNTILATFEVAEVAKA
jgi:predicted RNase H-like HicB family nuclease